MADPLGVVGGGFKTASPPPSSPAPAPPKHKKRPGQPDRDVIIFFADRPRDAKPVLDLPDINTLPENQQTVEMLIDCGKFRMAASLSRLLLDTTSLQDVSKRRKLTFHLAISYVRLHKFREAKELVVGAKVKGTSDPFNLSLLRCEISHYLGDNEEAVRKLFALKHQLMSKQGECLASGRELRLLNERIISYLVLGGRLELALEILRGEQAERAKKADSNTESKFGDMFLTEKLTEAKILLKIGDVKGAHELVEEYASAGGADAVELAHTRALILTADSHFEQAIKILQPYVELHGVTDNADSPGLMLKTPQDRALHVDLVNNYAVCCLFSNKIHLAITVLEAAVRTDPFQSLNLKVIQNLVALYDLCSMLHSKTVLRKVVGIYGGDDVIDACRRLNLW
ncbi:hypothetical protein AAMO2058_001459500 [Amorphochlora amoebiformis]